MTVIDTKTQAAHSMQLASPAIWLLASMVGVKGQAWHMQRRAQGGLTTIKLFDTIVCCTGIYAILCWFLCIFAHRPNLSEKRRSVSTSIMCCFSSFSESAVARSNKQGKSARHHQIPKRSSRVPWKLRRQPRKRHASLTRYVQLPHVQEASRKMARANSEAAVIVCIRGRPVVWLDLLALTAYTSTHQEKLVQVAWSNCGCWNPSYQQDQSSECFQRLSGMICTAPAANVRSQIFPRLLCQHPHHCVIMRQTRAPCRLQVVTGRPMPPSKASS